MSLVTRLLGFALCLVGAFVAGFYQSLHTTADGMNSLVFSVTVDKADFGQAVAAQVTSYIQQNITPVWAYYLAIGIAMAIGGAILVAIGDRKTKSAVGEQAPLQSQPVPVMRQE